jgi:NAD(P)-dependent dehydrogenase (short-subunit alcohol dehydrogenase family)
MKISAKEQRVLITAGAGGIGGVMARTFVDAGARVHICDVVQSAIDETRGALPGVTATLCDVSDPAPEDVANMALYLASEQGRAVTGQAISVCAGVETLG